MFNIQLLIFHNKFADNKLEESEIRISKYIIKRKELYIYIYILNEKVIYDDIFHSLLNWFNFIFIESTLLFHHSVNKCEDNLSICLHDAINKNYHPK